jgi:CheY-like chemotaxis protein
VSATPTIYFIDDSATMREVIKIAFRRENINVVAYSDAASALGQLEQGRPDIVISDVIMPDKDGYEVCQFIKEHPVFGNTPVILMSGVVNRSVAERAFAVKADELIRKPFQPQDLITRVRHLLKPGSGAPASPIDPAANAANAAAALSSIFQAPAATPPPAGMPRVVRAPVMPPNAFNAPPAASPFAQPAQASVPPQNAPQYSAPVSYAPPAAVAPATARPTPPPMPTRASVAAGAAPASAAPDVAKLRLEMLRLEGLVKKLQSELAAEREYAQALEAHIKTLQESE